MIRSQCWADCERRESLRDCRWGIWVHVVVRMATSRIIGNEVDGHIEAVRAALDGASEIIVIAGFATQGGFKLIKSEIKNCLDDGGRVTLVLGVDQAGITSANLVKTLRRLLRRYKKQLKVTLIFEQRGREFLHAKVYWGERRGSADANVVVGSANLTARAFQTNYELSLADSGNLREHKNRLLAFINSLRNAKKLTAKTAKRLAKEMQASCPLRPQEGSSKSNRETKTGTARGKVLSKTLGNAKPPVYDSTKTWEDYATDFVKEGILLVNEVDLDGMTISADLNLFYKKGILPKLAYSTAGSAEVRHPAPSARLPLFPADLTKNLATMQRNAKRRLTKNGFKTPFGVWVPKPLVKGVHEGVQDDFRDLPTTAALENVIEEELEKHRKSLTGTVEAIVAQVANGGICHPADWKSPPPKELQDIQHSYGNARKGWVKGNSAYDKTMDYIRKTLLDKLDRSLKPDICISKVRRLKPGLIRVPANLESDRISLATFLGEVAWQVAEHLQAKHLRPEKTRQTRDAVAHLCKRIKRINAGFVEQPEALAELSSKLLDSSELAKNANKFFQAFGPPPYWLPMLESHEVPGLLSATESELFGSRFRFHGDASKTARALEYDPDDCTNVVFWMAEQDERGFSYTELAEQAGEEQWEDWAPEEAACWVLEQLLERGELQSIGDYIG